MPSNHLILCRPLLLLPSVIPSIRVFCSESALRIRWPNYCSFSLSISPTNEYSGLISFRIDWFDLLAVQGTLKSLLQHHSSKASVLQPSAFVMVQLSHPYMTTGKTIALTIQTFFNNVMSPLHYPQPKLLRLVNSSHIYCLSRSHKGFESHILWRCHAYSLIFLLLIFLLEKCWRRKLHPTPVFLPGKSHGPRSLVGYGPQGR